VGIHGCQAPRTCSSYWRDQRGRAAARVTHYIFVAFICLHALYTHTCLYRQTRYIRDIPICEIHVGSRLHALYNIRFNDSVFTCARGEHRGHYISPYIFMRIFTDLVNVNTYFCYILPYNPWFRILFTICIACRFYR